MKINHATYKSQVTQVCDALEKKYGAKGKIDVNGGSFTIAEIVKVLKDSVTQIAVADAVRAQLRQAVQAERTSMTSARALLMSIERYLQGVFGPRNEVLLEFGFKPLSRRSKSSATKAQAATKARATREARHPITHTNGSANGLAMPAVTNGAMKPVNGAIQ